MYGRNEGTKIKLFIVGAFPKPITGLSVANQMLYQGLENKGITVEKVNTNTERKFTNLKDQGKLNFKKIIQSLTPIIKGLKKIYKTNYSIIYITPAQSFWGLLKYAPFIIMGKVRNTPVILHFHGGYIREMYDSLGDIRKNIIKRILNGGSKVIVLGESLVPMFYDIVQNKNILVCHNGIDESLLLKSEEFEMKIEKSDQKNELKILYLSNLMESKGILDLLKAFEVLNHDLFEYKLDIAGAIEPSIEDEVMFYISKNQRIIYHGIVEGEEKRKLLYAADIFCLPTYYQNEGQPISILEAMGMGCTIITTNQGGISDIFKNQVNGLECEKNNYINLSSVISEASTDISFFGRNNFYEAQNKYTSSIFVNRILEIAIIEEKNKKNK